MTFKQILVPLNASEGDEAILASAFTIAAPSNAHVAGLFVRPDARMVTPIIGFSLFPDVINEISKSAKQISDEAARAAHRRFTSTAINAKVTILDHPKPMNCVSASFHEDEGFMFECVTQAAKFADLVVFGPFDAPEQYQASTAFADVLLTAKRPVLICPKPISKLPKKVVIGWDGGHATARAVCAAIPLLAGAADVEIVTVGHVTSDGHAALADYLSLSGVTARKSELDKGSRTIGETLLEAAHKSNADLLVMGGYGHSPLRESIFGGTTAMAIADVSVPIFLAH
ncbi:MAG TPA: universal stress protein [Rhizomicrobium sp.]|nr:universal stress protein [Rhizomicrobium sp.]